MLLNKLSLCHFQTSRPCAWCPCWIVRLLPPWYNVSSIQQTSTFLQNSVSTTSQTLPLKSINIELSHPEFPRVLAWFTTMACLPHLTGGQARIITNGVFYVYWHCLTISVITIKILEHLFVFTRLPVLDDIQLSPLTASENCLVLINKAEKFICHSNSRSTSSKQEQTPFLLPEV